MSVATTHAVDSMPSAVPPHEVNLNKTAPISTRHRALFEERMSSGSPTPADPAPPRPPSPPRMRTLRPVAFRSDRAEPRSVCVYSDGLYSYGCAKIKIGVCTHARTHGVGGRGKNDISARFENSVVCGLQLYHSVVGLKLKCTWQWLMLDRPLRGISSKWAAADAALYGTRCAIGRKKMKRRRR